MNTKNVPLECAEVEKQIKPFLDWELNDTDAERFINHLHECPVCKEEFAIQYLISEGLKHLEDGSAFNLNHEMGIRLDSSVANINKRRVYNRIMIGLQVVSVFVLLFLCVFVLY